jgi:hypothetical protein
MMEPRWRLEIFPLFATSLCKCNDWLTRCQDDVSEWWDISTDRFLSQWDIKDLTPVRGQDGKISYNVVQSNALKRWKFDTKLHLFKLWTLKFITNTFCFILHHYSGEWFVLVECVRYKGSNTGKRARRKNLRHPKGKDF